MCIDSQVIVLQFLGIEKYISTLKDELVALVAK
jgi:hypothetical protein